MTDIRAPVCPLRTSNGRSEGDLEEESLKTIRSSATDMAESLFVDDEDDDDSHRGGSTPLQRKPAGFEQIKSLWTTRASAIRFAIPHIGGSTRQGSEGSMLQGVRLGSQTDPGPRLVPPIARSRSEGYIGPVDPDGRPLWRPSSGIAVRFKLRELNQATRSPLGTNEASQVSKKLAGDGLRCVSFSQPEDADSPARVCALQHALSGTHLSALDAPDAPAAAVSPLAPKKLASSPAHASPQPPPISSTPAPAAPPQPKPASKLRTSPRQHAQRELHHSAPAPPACWDFAQPLQPSSGYLPRQEQTWAGGGRLGYAAPPAPQWGAPDPFSQLIPTGVPAGMMIDASQGMMIDPNDPGYGYVYVVPAEPNFYDQGLAAQHAQGPSFFPHSPPQMASPPMGPGLAPPPMPSGMMMPNGMPRMPAGMPGMPAQHAPWQTRQVGGPPLQQRVGGPPPAQAQLRHSPPMLSQQPFGEHLLTAMQLPPPLTMPMMQQRQQQQPGLPTPQQQLQQQHQALLAGWAPAPAAARSAGPPLPPPPANNRAAGNRGQQAAAAGGPPQASRGGGGAGASADPAGGNRRGVARSAAVERSRGARMGLAVRATEQKQSRLLQQELMRMSDTQLAAACDELAPHLFELSTHAFGNYVVSKLASRAQAHAAVFGSLRGHVVELLKHPQGSRVVQAAIAELPTAEARALVGELDRHVLECALDTHGSWGICVAFKNTHAPFIVAQTAKHINALCTQQHGVRVVQQVLHEAAASQMDISAAVCALLEGELSYLAGNQYGNYAVQAALRHAQPELLQKMLDGLLPNILHLSGSKHGSNVAEMVLGLASEPQLEKVRVAVFGDSPLAELPQLRVLMSSPFGNYVLQALLRKLKDAKRALALAQVERHVSDDNFGRAILAAAAAA